MDLVTMSRDLAVAAAPPARLAPPRPAADCRHCGLPLPPGTSGAYCCEGCLAVSLLLAEEGLERYYDLRRGPAAPVVAPPAGRDRAWLEPLAADLATSPSLHRLSLDVQGLHCAGCVWLIEELFRRQPDGSQVLINPALGTIDLWVGPAFPLARFVESVERFGYQLGPARKAADARADGLLLRLGICLALAGNSMMLAAAGYFGLDGGRCTTSSRAPAGEWPPCRSSWAGRSFSARHGTGSASTSSTSTSRSAWVFCSPLPGRAGP